MEKRLAAVPFLAGGYLIADMAVYPWVTVYSQNIDNLATDFPQIHG